MERSEWARFGGVAGLTALALGQPVLDVFGQSTETFIFRGVGRAGYLAFGLVVLGVLPLGLWAIGWLIGRRRPQWRTAVHSATIATLAVGATTMAVQLSTGRHSPWIPALAMPVGIAAFRAHRRSAAVRRFTANLVVLPVIAMIWFVAIAPSSSILRTASIDIEERSASDVPVVMLVLDEFPTSTLVDGDGGVDPLRYPNLARLSVDGTWYRNYTTLSASTVRAVPTILTGEVPERGLEPTWTDRPESIFTALAPTHALRVRETVTQICPPSLCQATPELSGSGSERGAGLRGLLRDAVEVAGQLLDPTSAPDVGTDAFEEEVISLERLDGPDREDGGPGRQPARFTAFVDDLVATDDAVFHFLHLILPHGPWRFTHDGTEYVPPDIDPPGEIGGVWTDAWAADLTAFRLELQARYTDDLVGEVIERLERQELWDDAVLVVVADHGGSFRAGDRGRAITDTNAADVMWSPLFIRAPGLAPGPTDVNAQAIDVLPTVAALLDEPLGFEVDGASLVDRRGDGFVPVAGAAGTSSVKQYARFSNAFQPEGDALLEIDGDAEFARVLAAGRSSDRAAAVDPIGAYYRRTRHGALHGRRLDELDVGASADVILELDDLETLEAGAGEDPVPAFVGGSITAGEGLDGDPWVVVAVDGRVTALSPLFASIDSDQSVAMLLDPVELSPAGNAVEAFLVESVGAPLRPVDLEAA